MTVREFNPMHPGEFIYRTYIEPFNRISARKIARALCVAPSTFNRLLNGKTRLSPEMAVRLSIVLGRSAESWLCIQGDYDLWQAQKKINIKSFQKMNFEELTGER